MRQPCVRALPYPCWTIAQNFLGDALPYDVYKYQPKGLVWSHTGATAWPQRIFFSFFFLFFISPSSSNGNDIICEVLLPAVIYFSSNQEKGWFGSPFPSCASVKLEETCVHFVCARAIHENGKERETMDVRGGGQGAWFFAPALSLTFPPRNPFETEQAKVAGKASHTPTETYTTTTTTTHRENQNQNQQDKTNKQAKKKKKRRTSYKTSPNPCPPTNLPESRPAIRAQTFPPQPKHL